MVKLTCFAPLPTCFYTDCMVFALFMSKVQTFSSQLYQRSISCIAVRVMMVFFLSLLRKYSVSFSDNIPCSYLVMWIHMPLGLLPDALKCGLRMHRECRDRFLHHRLQRKPLASDPGMLNGTCVTHVPWCMSGLLTRGGEENVPGIPGPCTTRNFTYLARDP